MCIRCSIHRKNFFFYIVPLCKRPWVTYYLYEKFYYKKKKIKEIGRCNDNGLNMSGTSNIDVNGR